MEVLCLSLYCGLTTGRSSDVAAKFIGPIVMNTH